jgi:hypothetical protein
MSARLPIVVLVWLVLAAPARALTSAAAADKAVSPLDYTRTILEQARTIVAGNQTQDRKAAALSGLFGEFLDSDAMGREALGQHWSTSRRHSKSSSCPCSASSSNAPMYRICCCFRVLTSYTWGNNSSKGESLSIRRSLRQTISLTSAIR